MRNVHQSAFPTPLESNIVDRVRGGGGRPIISLVAAEHGEILGHIMLSPVTVGTARGGPHPYLGLGPMAVVPSRQREGIGARLVRASIEAARALDVGAVFVLGHPEYYPFFGFEPAGPRGLHFRSPEFDAAFFALELVPGALDRVQGTVDYDPAFDEA